LSHISPHNISCRTQPYQVKKELSVGLSEVDNLVFMVAETALKVQILYPVTPLD